MPNPFRAFTRRTSTPFIATQPQGINPQFLQAFWRLQKIILNTLEFDQVTQNVCDALLEELGFSQLGYRIVVLTLLSEDTKMLRRVAVSQTPEAKAAIARLPVKFEELSIPMTDPNNIMIKTIRTKQVSLTHSWDDLMTPVVAKADAETIQQGVGIKSSLVYPLIVNDKAIGAMIFSLAKDIDSINDTEATLLTGFVDVVAVSVQNADLYDRLKKSRDNLRAMNKRLTELDKLKDEFVSLASHELRTPMVSLRNYTWMLLNGKAGALQPKQKEYIRRIHESGGRLSRLVNSMLNISRLEAGRISLDVEQADIIAVTKAVVQEMEGRADQLGIKLEILQNESLPTVVIDVDKIKEVLINFVSNALKFSKPGGVITIAYSVDESFVTVKVIDHGIGLLPEEIPQLFKKFGIINETYLKTSGIVQGTGLGLYICKQIITLHDGQVAVVSEGREKGSTFSFTIPRYSAMAEQRLKQLSANNDAGIIHTELQDY